jgi:capsule biosynthesis phosphatase
MQVVILCGGTGTRLEDYSLPKPLNMINGKPSIAYCLQNLPASITTLHFIAAPHLAHYNFEEVVKNLFKQRTCIVHWIPYFTRGPVETAWLGTTTFPDSDESIVFLDNDVVYQFPDGFFSNADTAFLGYARDTTGSEAYSFVTVDGGYVTQYKEKRRISEYFCCGVYGFKDIGQFRRAATDLLNKETTTELYMSTLFQEFLAKAEPVRGIPFEGDVYHIGSLKELQVSWDHIQKKPMRVCFDLDNTLVTYPTKPGDYTTVKPIQKMIDLARKMKSEGHTIIIHTARRMVTHNNNVGAVIRDIGALTFQTLADFDIPFDELLFGKPIADMYIDDRAVNPYRDSVNSMGYLVSEVTAPLNMLGTNKHNAVSVVGNRIRKSGPTSFIRGEIYFYEHIPKESVLSGYFPKYYGSSMGDSQSQLYIEHIKAIPFYTLFKQELITEKHILHIFEFIDQMHHVVGSIPSREDMRANYIDKLVKRFAVPDDYPFPDALLIQKKCLDDLASYEPTGVGFIHGDLWFSNILVDFHGALKMIDMKGQVNGVLITGGDRMYDYGKLYQSFLGYDAVLYGDTVSASYHQTMMDIFLREINKRGIVFTDLTRVTASLIIGTVPFIGDPERKARVWDFVKSIL